MFAPILCSSLSNSVTNIINVLSRHGANEGDPRLPNGEYYLTDEHGNYLTDENGAYLIGKDAQ